MEAYQQRVVEERDQLSKRVEKLETFIGGAPRFRACLMDEQARLRVQLAHMHAYLGVLNERILLWRLGGQE
jgi:hypothetical protein